jgi:hypothetical protein
MCCQQEIGHVCATADTSTRCFARASVIP